MDTRTQINSIIRNAEKLHQSEDYINAFQELDNVVTELNIIIKAILLKLDMFYLN